MKKAALTPGVPAVRLWVSVKAETGILYPIQNLPIVLGHVLTTPPIRPAVAPLRIARYFYNERSKKPLKACWRVESL